MGYTKKAPPYEVKARYLNSMDTLEFVEVRIGGDGVLYCTCQGWRFSKAPKTCKHLVRYAEEQAPGAGAFFASRERGR